MKLMIAFLLTAILLVLVVLYYSGLTFLEPVYDGLRRATKRWRGVVVVRWQS